MSGLPPRRVPAADFAQAFRILTVALVVTPRTVFAPASCAQANPRARPAPSGPTVAFSRNVVDAHGRLDLPRESPGECATIRPGRYQNSNKNACSQVSAAGELDKERNSF